MKVVSAVTQPRLALAGRRALGGSRLQFPALAFGDKG